MIVNQLVKPQSQSLGFFAYMLWHILTLKTIILLVNALGQGFSNVQSYYYWSSTAYNRSNSWVVLFSAGSSHYGGVGITLYVWPVRGGQQAI